MVGPNQKSVFLLKMIILGCFGGYHHLRKQPCDEEKGSPPPPKVVYKLRFRDVYPNKDPKKTLNCP